MFVTIPDDKNRDHKLTASVAVPTHVHHERDGTVGGWRAIKRT